MKWMLLPLRRYAQFSGRSRPREYWMFVLFLLLGIFAFSWLDVVFGFSTGYGYYAHSGYGTAAGYVENSGLLTRLFTLATLIPGLAVAVRRLHDTDRSGWWLLIGLVPLLGEFVLFIFMLMSGTRGPNRYGPDPVDEGMQKTD
jgi:uncharacterized membrane protein YhaH (DUF805 family)